jgi:hypothetical protein
LLSAPLPWRSCWPLAAARKKRLHRLLRPLPLLLRMLLLLPRMLLQPRQTLLRLPPLPRQTLPPRRRMQLLLRPTLLLPLLLLQKRRSRNSALKKRCSHRQVAAEAGRIPSPQLVRSSGFFMASFSHSRACVSVHRDGFGFKIEAVGGDPA